MIRVWSLCLIVGLSGVARAQDRPVDNHVDALTALRQSAEKATANWESLAAGLEPKIARMLPCDPKSRTAVEEVSHASEARLSALAAYLKAAAAKAKEDTDAAKRVFAAQAALAGGWNTERAEADQEHTAIEAQIAELKESMRKRGSLSGAAQTLVELSRLAKERAEKADTEAAGRDSLNSLLGDLVVGYQDRQTALENESALIDGETVKWSAYYQARVSRAITECSIINAGAPKKKLQ
jgi:hypothetical protein